LPTSERVIARIWIKFQKVFDGLDTTFWGLFAQLQTGFYARKVSGTADMF